MTKKSEFTVSTVHASHIISEVTPYILTDASGFAIIEHGTNGTSHYMQYRNTHTARKGLKRVQDGSGIRGQVYPG